MQDSNKILNPGVGAGHVQHQHITGPNDENDTSPRNIKTPSGLNPEDEWNHGEPEEEPQKAYTQTNPNGNLYNTENDKPIRMDTYVTETGSNRTSRDLKRLERVKLGDHVSYSKGEGTIVSKENMYVKIANDNQEYIDTVPIGETYFKDDILATSNVMNQLWDMMVHQDRSSVLTKVNIKGEVQKAYLYRAWDDIPTDVQTVIKEGNYYDAVPSGGFSKEPTFNDNNEESRSFRDLTQPKHVTAPYKDANAPAFKSDVEHGAYGGVVTDTPFDAPEDYEEDERTGERQGTKYQDVKEPRDPKKIPKDSKWNEEDSSKPTYHTKEDKGILPEEEEGSDYQADVGTEENQQAKEKDSSMSTSTTGVSNPVFGEGPTKQRNQRNKYNSRWGPREASEDDIKELSGRYITKRYS